VGNSGQKDKGGPVSTHPLLAYCKIKSYYFPNCKHLSHIEGWGPPKILELAFSPTPMGVSADLSHSGICGYRLHYGTSSHGYSQTIDLGNTTTTTVSNLPPGQTYYIALTDYDTAGVESTDSNEVSFTAANPIPNGSGVSKDFNNDGKVDLIWENTSNGACIIWNLNNGVVVPNATIALPTLGPGWQIAAVGDFLANRQSDLDLENTIDGSHCIWVMNKGVYVYTIALPTLAGGVARGRCGRP
jgi:FG-GAP-like repeat